MTTVINGTTGIDKVQDGSIVQADLGVNVAGNGPAFSVYQSVAQSLPNGTMTKCQLQSKEFDTNNAFDSTTNFRFQPTVAGYYQVNGGFQVGATVTLLAVSVFKNGVTHKQLQLGPSNVSSISAYGCCLVYLNGSTDYVELWIQQNSTAQNTAAGIANTYFQGFLARAA